MRRIMVLLTVAGILLTAPLLASPPGKEDIKPPYTLHKCLLRAEELFRSNNYSEALIFYYEAFALMDDEKMRGKLHFRIGECLEAVRRFDFATWHYQQAIKHSLPDVLVSRVIMKLEHLPEMAQKEEATRLFNSAMKLYKKRNIREAIDDYLASLRLMPSLMAHDESGLIDDAVKYLTYLSESKEKEPDRLLKLATLLELRGDIEKAIETFQQIIIIYPDSDQARQAEEKLQMFSARKTAYLEPVKPRDAIAELSPEPEAVIFNETFDFRNAGTISRELDNCAFTFKAINEHPGVPAERFELFNVILGRDGEQKELLYTADEGIDEKQVVFDTMNFRYTLVFVSVSQTRGYLQDLYGEGKKTVNLFSDIRVNLKIERLAN
ncbi:MAG: hypothetical protein Kow0029_02990 [Candidatus Rifleibacteriota bacterium]